MNFLLTDAPTSGIALGNVGIPSVTISNGLFTVPLSFDPGVFDGTDRWLEISVQTNGGFLQTISPRQRITPSPYAIMANSASNLLGNLPSQQLSGTSRIREVGANHPIAGETAEIRSNFRLVFAKIGADRKPPKFV
jgi:hypothetical protein